MKEETQSYYRIGNGYFYNVRIPLISGDFIERLIPIREKFIVDDNSKDFLYSIPKYHGFCCIPDHKNYSKVINKFYNTYHELLHKPKKGEIMNTLKLLRHIFGDQVEYALDYLKILYEKPTQMLPVLCLVSQERNTGKTTILNGLKLIYSSNMTINKTEDFRSPFNSDWLGRLIIGVDEVLFDRKEDQEKIKNLSTAKSYKMEAKGYDRVEIEFFGHLILISNHELTFTKIDAGETRYWVRKILSLKVDDVDFLQKLETEIPAFLYYLINRPYKTTRVSRMWFNPNDLKTEALSRVVRHSRDSLETELANIIYNIIEALDLVNFEFCPADLKSILSKTQFSNVEQIRLKRIYKKLWKLKPAENNLSYTQIQVLSDGTFIENKKKGRFFTLSKNFLLEYYGDLLT
jgi:hypothetical protein